MSRHITTKASITTWDSGVIDVNVPTEHSTFRIERVGKVFHVSVYWMTKPSKVLAECNSLDEAIADVFRRIADVDFAFKEQS